MKKIIIILLTVHCSLFTFHSSIAQVIHVPANQPTIQEGINAAIDGDTVLVADGTYLENINYLGKAITVASQFIIDADTNHINNTVIDGSQPSDPDNGSVVIFETGEDTTSVLCGFTITGGTGSVRFFFNANGRIGGGLLCYLTGAKIINNKIINNHVENTGWAGGGALCQYASTQECWIVLKNNILAGNSCSSSTLDAFGGGIYVNANLICEENDVYFNSCTGTGNANADGGGIEFEELSGKTMVFQVQDNDIHDNSIDGYTIYGAGLTFYAGEGTVSGNEIHHNTGTAGSDSMTRGGGLMLLSMRSKTYIMNNVISNNSLVAKYPAGGGIAVRSSVNNIFIQDNIIEQNSLTGSSASWGGGVELGENGQVVFSGNQVNGNTVSGVDFSAGAGLWCELPYDKTLIRNNVFSSNSGQTGYGGGVGFYNDQLQRVEIEGNRFENNSMSYGGGLWTYNSYDMPVTNNIFMGNSSSICGGAIMLNQYTGQLTSSPPSGKDKATNKSLPVGNVRAAMHPVIMNNTFYNNSSNLGGAIYTNHEAEFPLIVNSTFWRNIATYGNSIYNNGPDSLLISYSNIDLSHDTSIYGKWKGTANFVGNPGFIDESCHIDQFSPCVDAGTDSLELESTWYYAPDIDFEGTPRPWNNGRVDIGADECDIFTKVPGLLVSDEPGIVLGQNRPNPCSNYTQIEFSLPKDGLVSLKLYDISGREIETLISDYLQEGKHTISLNTVNLVNGVLFYRLSAGNEVETMKMVINK